MLIGHPAADRPVASAPPAPPRRPVWISGIATVVAVAVCVSAGNWQRGRMEGKEALRAQLDAASAAPPLPLPVGAPDWSAWRFRPVIATGEFDARHQILIDNRVHSGVGGYAVVTPLRLGDGRVVLVDRGFVPAGPSRAALPDVAPPSGDVRVEGRVNLVATGYLELAPENGKGPVRQHLDLGRFTASTGIAVLPIVIEATAPTGPEDRGLARDRAPPDLGIDKHRMYMGQWYAFAAMAAGFWIWFALRPRLRSRS